jgi:CRP-like cAMP-binding protein
VSADPTLPEFVPPRANALLRGLTEAQLAWVESRLTPRDFLDGQHVFQQGDAGQEIFLICSGKVEVYVERDGRSFVLASLEPGDYFGEMALIDEAPRSASVRAVGDARLTALNRRDLRAALDAPGGAIWPALIMQHAHQQNRRLVRTNEATVAALRREIATAQLHRRLALVLTLVVALVTAYAFLVALFQKTSGVGLLYTSLGIAAGASLGAVVFIRTSREPLRTFGLTFEHLGRALGQATAWAAVAILAATALKAVLVRVWPAWRGLPVIHMSFALPGTGPGWTWEAAALFLSVYAVSSLVQEFAARGFLQSSCQLLLPGPHRERWAIILSNLLFAVFHLHYHVAFAVLTFASGLLYGAFWRRHRNLTAVAWLHYLTGVWAMRFLDIFQLPGLALR